MFTASIFARGKAAIAGSETEQRISVLLYDDAVQEISSFELNQLASLTYHEAQVIASATDMAGLLVDHLEKIMSQPAQFSTVSMQKSLAVTEHLLLFGAEKVIRMIQEQLGRHVDGLRAYNTVLLAQQQQYGSWWMQLKGGGVDQGGPVRDKAQVVVQYLSQPHLLHHERQRQADPNSLVPIGSPQQVAFCTDAMRLQKLKEQIERQHAMQIRSNLAKASDGFGSGYNAANGQMVVGAAHGLEEMLAQQRKQEQKFRDDRQAAAATTASHAGQTGPAGGFAEYRAPNLLDDRITGTTTTNLNSQHSSLYMGTGGLPAAPPPAVDLLDMSSWTTTTAASTPASVPAYEAPVQQDLLAFALPDGAVSSPAPPLPSTAQGQIIIDPFAPSTTRPSADHQDLLGHTNTTTPTTTTIVMQQGSAAAMMSQPSAGTQIMSTTLSHAALPSTTTNNNDPFAGMAMSASPRPMVLANAQPSSSADKFAALDGKAALPIGGRCAGAPVGHSATGADWNNLLSAAAAAATTSVVPPATTTTPISLSSIRIGQTVPQHTTTNMHSSIDDNSDMYMMGGITGTGLAPPPMASPPPPPPGGGFF